MLIESSLKLLKLGLYIQYYFGESMEIRGDQVCKMFKCNLEYFNYLVDSEKIVPTTDGMFDELYIRGLIPKYGADQTRNTTGYILQFKDDYFSNINNCTKAYLAAYLKFNGKFEGKDMLICRFPSHETEITELLLEELGIQRDQLQTKTHSNGKTTYTYNVFRIYSKRLVDELNGVDLKLCPFQSDIFRAMVEHNFYLVKTILKGKRAFNIQTNSTNREFTTLLVSLLLQAGIDFYTRTNDESTNIRIRLEEGESMLEYILYSDSPSPVSNEFGSMLSTRGMF